MSAGPPAGADPVDPDPGAVDPHAVERTLRAAHAEAVRRIAGLTGHFEELVAASQDSNADDEHDPEGQTIAFERSQLDSSVARARTALREVDAALARLAAGAYGRCEACGAPVAAARLDALPTARTCIDCATRARRG